MYSSLTFLPHSNFAVFDGWYFLQYCLQRIEIAQIAQLNQLCQILHLVHIYGHSFFDIKSYANEEKCKQWHQQSLPITIFFLIPRKLTKIGFVLCAVCCSNYVIMLDSDKSLVLDLKKRFVFGDPLARKTGASKGLLYYILSYWLPGLCVLL